MKAWQEEQASFSRTFLFLSTCCPHVLGEPQYSAFSAKGCGAGSPCVSQKVEDCQEGAGPLSLCLERQPTGILPLPYTHPSGKPQELPASLLPLVPILGRCQLLIPAAFPTGSGPHSGERCARPAWPQTPAHSPGAGRCLWLPPQPPPPEAAVHEPGNHSWGEGRATSLSVGTVGGMGNGV